MQYSRYTCSNFEAWERSGSLVKFLELLRSIFFKLGRCCGKRKESSEIVEITQEFTLKTFYWYIYISNIKLTRLPSQSLLTLLQVMLISTRYRGLKLDGKDFHGYPSQWRNLSELGRNCRSQSPGEMLTLHFLFLFEQNMLSILSLCIFWKAARLKCTSLILDISRTIPSIVAVP